MVRTLSDLNTKAQESLEMLRENPYCPPGIDDEIEVFSDSRVSGLIPWQQDPAIDEIYDLLIERLDKHDAGMI